MQGVPQGWMRQNWETFKDFFRPFNRLPYQGDTRPVLQEYHILKQMLFWGLLMTGILMFELVIMHFVSFPTPHETTTFGYKIRYPDSWRGQLFTEMTNPPHERLSSNRTIGESLSLCLFALALRKRLEEGLTIIGWMMQKSLSQRQSTIASTTSPLRNTGICPWPCR